MSKYVLEMEIPSREWEKTKHRFSKTWFITREPELTRHRAMATPKKEYAAFKCDSILDIKYVVSNILPKNTRFCLLDASGEMINVA